MSGDIPNLRRRLQELHELHATGFVDDAQYAESQALLERWIVDAVMKEAALPDNPAAVPLHSDAPPMSAEPTLPAAPKSAGRWVLWLGAAALVHLVAIGIYWWSSSRAGEVGVETSNAVPGGGASPSAPIAPNSAAASASVPARPTASANTPVAARSVASIEGAGAAEGTEAASTPANGANNISGMVVLSSSLLKQARPDDTVFIFARAVDGPPMPLAVLRKRVKDLPLAFVFDDSMAMWPAAKVSAFSRVVVTARVSKSGEGKPRPGDLEGHSAPVAVGATGLLIEIGSVVPN